jgi:hypothetical protein
MSFIMKPLIISTILSLLTIGCGTVSTKYAVSSEVTPLNVSASLGEEMFADVGDTIFMKGKASKQKVLLLKNSITSNIPGAYGLPFQFGLKKGPLSPLYQTANHIHYSANWEDCSATHSMLGVVIRRGDSVGIRISKTTGDKEWFVDNSVYNGMNTVWSRKVKPEDNVEFEWSEEIVYDKGSEYIEVTFDGFFNNLFHFTLTEIKVDSQKDREFKFNPVEGVTRVSFKGMILDILKADNLGISYKWVKLP